MSFAKQNPLHDSIIALAKPLAQSMNLEIWGLEITGGGHLLLRLYVERPVGEAETESSPEVVSEEARQAEDADDSAAGLLGKQGINIDQCAKLSYNLGLALDALDVEGAEGVVPTAYTLEVSSPGLERVFFSAEQVRHYAGQRLSLSLTKARDEYPKRKNFIGLILAPAADAPERLDVDHFAFLPDDGPEPGVAPKPLRVAWAEVKKAQLIYDFEAGKGKKRSQKA